MKLGKEPLRSSKPIYVFNATPVIHFSKIGSLNLILEICDAFITTEVYLETVTRGENFPDSLAIEEAVKSGRLKVYEVKMENTVKTLLKHGEIHKGEVETIVAAKELEGTAIIDDEEARVIAKVYNVKAAPGCLFLLFRLLKLRKIDTSEAKNMLERLIKSGLHLDPETLLEAYRRIEQRLQSHR
jgi:predicted nucleic acid-binding protein